MSMRLHLYPCVERNPASRYLCETRFELSSWCFALSQIQAASRPIDKPVELTWVRTMELRTPDAIDTDATWLVPASAVKTLPIDPDWHPDVISQHRAIEAYFQQLPDDWPVLVYYL